MQTPDDVTITITFYGHEYRVQLADNAKPAIDPDDGIIVADRKTSLETILGWLESFHHDSLPEALPKEEADGLAKDLKQVERLIQLDGWRLPPDVPADARVLTYGSGYPPSLIDSHYDFYCPYCGKKYASSSPLNRHLVKVHQWPGDENGDILPAKAAK